MRTPHYSGHCPNGIQFRDKLFHCHNYQHCLHVYVQGAESSVDPPANNFPQWLERPGASEAVVVGADIRSRYGALKTETRTKADEVCYFLCTI